MNKKILTILALMLALCASTFAQTWKIKANVSGYDAVYTNTVISKSEFDRGIKAQEINKGIALIMLEASDSSIDGAKVISGKRPNFTTITYFKTTIISKNKVIRELYENAVMLWVYNPTINYGAVFCYFPKSSETKYISGTYDLSLGFEFDDYIKQKQDTLELIQE